MMDAYTEYMYEYSYVHEYMESTACNLEWPPSPGVACIGIYSYVKAGVRVVRHLAN
jgi:hypothetical protein